MCCFFNPLCGENPYLAAFLWSLSYVRMCGREEQQGRLWGCSAAVPGAPQPWLEKQWREGGLERRASAYGERKEVAGGYSWAQERSVRAKGDVGHLPVQTMVTEQTPGRSNSTPGEPEGNHLKFKDKWAEGEGVAAVCEEPPRSPEQATRL